MRNNNNIYFFNLFMNLWIYEFIGFIRFILVKIIIIIIIKNDILFQKKKKIKKKKKKKKKKIFLF